MHASRCRSTEFTRYVADIPIAIALVAIDQRAFNHLEVSEGSRCLGKELCSISPVGKAKNDALGIVSLHVQKRTNFWAGESPLPDRLLWEISAVRERQVQARFRGHFAPIRKFFDSIAHVVRDGVVALGSVGVGNGFVTQGFAWGDTTDMRQQNNASARTFAA